MICVESVKVIPSCIKIKQGEWYHGTWGRALPSNATNRTLHWYSNKPNIATVRESTISIYGVSPGKAQIYAIAKDGSNKSDYIEVTVTQGDIYVSSISLNKTNVTLQEGTSTSITPTVYPYNATNKALKWYSSNPDVAEVINNRIVAKSAGWAEVCANSTDGSKVSASCQVRVTRNILVNSVDINKKILNLKVGESEYLSASVSPSNATNDCILWSSSNSGIASVNEESGLVIANNSGVATIYANAQDGSGKRDCCDVYVEDIIYAEFFHITGPDYPLYPGDTYRLIREICPPDAEDRPAKWESNNRAVVTVDQNTGVITAKGAGEATVKAVATDGSGIVGVCRITVRSSGVKPAPEKPKSTVAGSTFADPVDLYTGAHIIKNTIMTLYGGQGLSLVAHYDSNKLVKGSLGLGWYHNYEKRLSISDTQALVYSSPSVYNIYAANSDSTVYTCTSANKNKYVLTIDCSQEYPYIIDCNSQCTEYYDTDGRLAKIVNHEGLETLITYNGVLTTITDTVTGKKMYLEKNSSGKIIRVYDDCSREATFTYSGNCLTDVHDMNGNKLSYTYNEYGQILTGTDSRGICYFTNTYDDYGRVSAQKDGITNSILSTFSYDGNTRITTDRNGNKSTRVFNNNGLLIRHTDENGNIKTYSYDNRYNVIKETDGNGNSVIKSYNSFNKPTEITDRNGNKTYISYDNRGNIVKITHPEVDGVVPEETFVYNERNQVTQHTDLRGTVTVYSYDDCAMPASKKVGSKNAIQYSYQNGLLKSQTDAMGYTTLYGHNSIGQVISMTDAANNITQYEYDAWGNLLKTTDANGKTIVNTYDGNHQKKSVTDANDNTTEYSYNGNMKNEVITLPDNNTIRYEFDGEDRPVKMIDQAGNVTITTYDNCGRVIAKHFADGSDVKYEYDNVGNVIKETNPKGAVTVKTYDANGNVLSVTDNDGNITRYQYNAMGKKVRAVNAVSGTVTYQYSKAGDLLSETDALGNKKTYTYDAFGNMLTATDAKGNVTTYTYDANNNMLSVRDALGNTTTYTYNSQNLLESVKDANNNTVTYGYDALGRRTTITDAKNNVFTTTYDGNGNVLKTLDAKGNTISETVYNNLNKPATVTDATGKTTTYTYTPLGKIYTSMDSMNHRQEYSYNLRGQNTSVRDANNGTSSAEYDTLGNITKLAGPMGSTVNYTYDEMGRLICETTSSGGTITYGYNALNIKEQLTNARGQKRKYFYDAMGRITGYVGEEDSVSYTYDANGNVLTVTDGNGIISREYDALNRVTKYTDTFGKSIQYTYDAVGNLASIIYPDNTAVNYTYDANNNLISVTDWANRVTSYTYDVNNMVVGVTKPDGSVTTTVYDNAQRIISTVEKTASGKVITGFEYVYDSLSRIVEEKHLAENTKTCYTYDSLNRVTNRTVRDECDCDISSENYTYDSAGNITDAPNSCFIYDTNNRLTTFNGNTVSYDLDGNMLSNGYINCEFDSGNRLISAGGHTYTYNAEDVRIRNLCSDYDTVYTYNTNCKLSQLLTKTTNGITTKYVYGHGLIGEEKCGEFKTYHFDYRGSTVAITNATGEITDTFKYDTYGKLVSRTGSSFVIFGYNGRDGVVTDKNGLIYMRARYYSPDMRRFINADIISGEISNAVTLNRYAYANGNPVSNTDPFGLSAERGSLIYNGVEYPIYVPPINSGYYYSAVWKTVKSMRKNLYDINWEEILTNIEMENFGVDAGNPKAVGYFSLFASALSIANNIAGNIDGYYVDIKLQSSGDNNRAIITLGTKVIEETLSQYPDGWKFSTYDFYNRNNGLGNIDANNKTRELYKNFTGKSLPNGGDWDYQMQFDNRWKTNGDIAYLWFDDEDRLMGSSIVYSGDKLNFGKRSGLFYLNYEPKYNITLKSSEAKMPENLSDIVDELFDKQNILLN